MPAQPLKVTDLTLRDGHQSLFATRMRTDDILNIIGDMDQAGFHSMEVWGGATFDVPIRFLNEDPWDRLREMKKRATKTPLQMLLRGQNLVGYRNYADDVATAFVEHAADCGVDIFRVFDAVNDERNFETVLKAIKSKGKHAQLAISYSLTERTMGGPVYHLDYYIEKAKTFEAMGADSFCIKDMAGIISPIDAYNLVKALKKAIKIPVQFKIDLGDPSRFKNLGEFVFAVYQTIWKYNNTRIHSALKMPPAKFAFLASKSYNVPNKDSVQ